MKTITILSFILLASAGAQHYDSPAQVTDSVIAKYKQGMKDGCLDASQHMIGDSPAKAEAYCGCMMKRLDDRLTHSEWQSAFFYADSNDHAEEMKVLLPHLQDLPTCRDGP